MVQSRSESSQRQSRGFVSMGSSSLCWLSKVTPESGLLLSVISVTISQRRRLSAAAVSAPRVCHCVGGGLKHGAPSTPLAVLVTAQMRPARFGLTSTWLEELSNEDSSLLRFVPSALDSYALSFELFRTSSETLVPVMDSRCCLNL